MALLLSNAATAFTATPLCNVAHAPLCAPVMMSANKYPAKTEQSKVSLEGVGVVVPTGGVATPATEMDAALKTAMEALAATDASISEMESRLSEARAERETLSSDVARLTEEAKAAPAPVEEVAPVEPAPVEETPEPEPVASAAPAAPAKKGKKAKAKKYAKGPGKKAQATPEPAMASTPEPAVAPTPEAAAPAEAVTADSIAAVLANSGVDTTPAALRRKAEWNPKSLGVPSNLPGPADLFAKQFEPSYLEASPAYLDGSMSGDVGFDPWALTVLANPTMTPDALQQLDKVSRTAKERNERMLSLSAEEQQANLMWMRSSELKHGRLAMLASAGWVMTELFNKGALKELTNGRAPSLFNGHLLDYTPFLFAFFGGLAAIEIRTKDSVKDGDYGFDPLGFGSGLGSMGTLKTAEIKHGRAAMMGITGFAVQEFVWGTPVVEQTPFFFLPFGGIGA